MAEKDTVTAEERRARRQARREKQRETNLSRASKMHLARLSSEEAGGMAPPSNLPVVNVGCSGWYYWHWRGLFYPKELPSSQWFAHYASNFDTVELNAPFYAWPSVNTVKTWRRQAGDRNFLYTVKVSELITHVKRFSRTKTLVKDFGYIADVLAERMGCFLFQLPPSYHYTSVRLKSILSQMDPHRRNVVEFRHKSWWNEKVYSAFRAAGVIFCSSSGPKLPGDLVKTTDEVYIRFHGTTKWYRHYYTAAELADWTRSITDSGASRVFAYFNNDRDGHAIDNAKTFREQLLKAFQDL